MPKVLLKSKQKKRNCLSVLLLFSFIVIQAQNKIVIAYGDQIHLGNVPEDTRFEIQGPKSLRLKGNKINQFHFDKPGVYTLKVDEKKHQDADCTRLHLPSEIEVEVRPVKMTFTQPIEFSSPIVKNKETRGITLKVPIVIQTYDHRPAVLNRAPVASAGIGSNIVAQLKTEVATLPEGNHFLEYSLNGMATENAYLMFDFVDANGKIQSIPVVTPVKN